MERVACTRLQYTVSHMGLKRARLGLQPSKTLHRQASSASKHHRYVISSQPSEQLPVENCRSLVRCAWEKPSTVRQNH